MNTRMHRTLTTTTAALLLAAAVARADSDLPQQLQAAESKNDRPAIVEICRRLVEADAGNLDALRKLVRTSFVLGDIETTRRYLTTLKESAGADDPDVLETEGDLLARGDRDDEAVAAWQSALKENRDNAALLAKLGYHFLFTKDGRENAAYYFEQLLALRASASDHIIVAEAAAMRRDWNTVIERTATLKADFTADAGAKRKVPSLERLLDSMLRIAMLDKRIEAAQPPVPLLLERGLLFRELGFPEIGLIDARRAIKMEPDALYVRMAYAIIGGPVWSEHERINGWGIYARAFRSHMPDPTFLEHLVRMETTLLANPSDGDTLCERAMYFLKNSQRTLALRDIDAALVAEADNPQALHLKASALRDAGKFSEAVSHIERALAVQPDDPEILRAAIALFAAQGEFERAIALCDAFPASADRKERDAVRKNRATYCKRLQQQVPAKP